MRVEVAAGKGYLVEVPSLDTTLDVLRADPNLSSLCENRLFLDQDGTTLITSDMEAEITVGEILVREGTVNIVRTIEDSSSGNPWVWLHIFGGVTCPHIGTGSSINYSEERPDSASQVALEANAQHSTKVPERK